MTALSGLVELNTGIHWLPQMVLFADEGFLSKFPPKFSRHVYPSTRFFTHVQVRRAKSLRLPGTKGGFQNEPRIFVSIDIGVFRSDALAH
jgi:hypothetical protein